MEVLPKLLISQDDMKVFSKVKEEQAQKMEELDNMLRDHVHSDGTVKGPQL